MPAHAGRSLDLQVGGEETVHVLHAFLVGVRAEHIGQFLLAVRHLPRQLRGPLVALQLLLRGLSTVTDGHLTWRRGRVFVTVRVR